MGHHDYENKPSAGSPGTPPPPEPVPSVRPGQDLNTIPPDEQDAACSRQGELPVVPNDDPGGHTYTVTGDPV